MTASKAPTLSTLPPDALLSILAHLHPSDITRLRAAFPPLSIARELTHDPCLWRRLFRQHFPAAHGYCYPRLIITPDGRLDWHAAYLEAARRRQALTSHNDRQKFHFPQRSHPPLGNSTPANIRIEMQGNMRRIISATADNSAANVTWDRHTAAARFDWTGRAQPLTRPDSIRKSRLPRPDGDAT